MQLAILHYHLNPGGVTQVVRNHVRALVTAGGGSAIERILLIHGGRRAGWPDGNEPCLGTLQPTLVPVPELEYDDPQSAGKDSELALSIQDQLEQRGCKPETTVLHLHNHALGKNVSLPGAVAHLAERGYRFLLQIHDFAEDYRPDNYRRLVAGLNRRGSRTLPSGQPASLLYPQADQIHYAVLNGRDRAILARAGVRPSQLHRLPNPIAPFDNMPSRVTARSQLEQCFGIPPDRPYFLYPVRGIRRKNLGETVLWSALLADRVTTAITLRPRNPLESASYDRWEALARELKLPVLFGVGQEGRLAFQENLVAADAVLSTSVAEGFGLVFLESWLAGRLLVGRDLPEITVDFTTVGIDLPWLYDRLAIPLECIHSRQVRKALLARYRIVCQNYGQEPIPDAELERDFNRLTADGTIDFVFLEGAVQRDIVRRAATDRRVRDTLREQTPMLDQSVAASQCKDTWQTPVARNGELVHRHFGLLPIGQRLLAIYRKILNSNLQFPLASLPRADTILPSFLELNRLHPIRMEP